MPNVTRVFRAALEECAHTKSDLIRPSMREISMTTNRIFLASSPLTLGVIGVLLIATVCLIAFPGNMAVWQTASWTLVLALMALCLLVPLSAYSLATRRVTRTWQRIASCATGFIILVVVAIGWLS